MESWAHHGQMDQGSKEKGEDEMAGGSGTVKVEEEEASM